MVIDVGREMMVVGQDRKLKSTISLKKHDSWHTVIDGTNLYVPSTGHRTADDSPVNAVVAIDLNTGQPRWKSSAGKGRYIEPLRMEGGKLIAYRKPTYDDGGEIIAIDPAEKGEQKLLLRNPDDRKDVEHDFTRAPNGERPLYENGKLYLQVSALSENPLLDGPGKYISAAFGPK
jgi:hypothetical protein